LLGAYTGGDRIDRGIAAVDRDLGSHAGSTRPRAHHHDAGRDLRDLASKQLDDPAMRIIGRGGHVDHDR
jgi:hypothetical protein